MKLVLTDIGGAEHDLDAVVLGLAADVYRLNQRLMRVEAELDISYQDAKAQAIVDTEESDGSTETE